MPKFTVDTHLFRELGELLVGRDSTALIELIKNSYDADATEVIVHGENLDDPERGRIVVMDDGTGMTEEQFVSGFLRIASRLKDVGLKRSTVYRRRYTGVKGIGRLAAHKLARRLEVESIHAGADADARPTALHGVIDWDAIERYETLDDIPGDVVSLDEQAARKNASHGTTLTLSSLRRPWTVKERAKFLLEVQALDAPAFIRQPLPRSVIPKPLLFEAPLARDVQGEAETRRGAGFQTLLEGEFAAGEDYWDLLAEMANWVLEIRAARDGGLVHFVIAPTQRGLVDNPEAAGYSSTMPHPAPEHGPFFDARILVREGAIKGKGARDLRAWASNASGIRVYLEGFRVLPYGEDDWLSIDADYSRRPRRLEMLSDLSLGLELENVDTDEGLVRVPSNNYFGGVFLTQEDAPTLKILVNREGFVPNAGFDTLVSLVRTGVDLCTRVRAAAGWERRQTRKKQRRQRRASEMEEHLSLPDLMADAAASIEEARLLLGEGRANAVERIMLYAARRIDEAKHRADIMISELPLLRVLASVGTQMAAFVHEMNALLGAAQSIAQALTIMLDDRSLSRDQRRRTRQAWAASADLKQWLERHASYLIDVISPDARRRRSRQRFADRFDTAVRLIQHYAERRRVDIHNRIPVGLMSPPMFPAELTTVFANVLTNAVKAAQKDGQIDASAIAATDDVRIRVQNTGVAVDLEEAERWFKAFESTTQDVTPVLGQGMGLGLTITRRMLDYYGITVRFVEPAPDYATAIELVFPK